MDIQNLKDYLNEHPLQYRTGKIESLMEELYFSYCENNPSVTPELRELYKQANAYFAKLTMEEADALFCRFGQICTKHEQLAFYSGMRMGMQLTLELLAQK